jgi:DNA-binding transcriptional MerR regulator
MIKIGDFSRLSQVPVSTLRYYDEVGLIKPASVDRATGYRYYTMEQLPRLNRILALRDLGFALEQIARLLDDDLSPAHMREILRMKQAELQRRVREDQERLTRVEWRLQQIELEGTMTSYEIILKQVPPQLVAGVRETIPNWDALTPALNRNFDALENHVKAHDAFAGPFLDMWHTMETGDTNFDVEAVAPIQRPIPETERIKVHTLPGVEQMASTIHHGPFATIGQAHGALFEWVSANGYTIAGPAREVYLQYARDGDQNDFITEIQCPVEKV